eukprot:2274921-Amphidinium_carterae.1
MSTDCLRGDLSSSDDDGTSWVFLDLLGGTQGYGARGFTSMQEECNFYLDAAKHIQEVEEELTPSTKRGFAGSLGDGAHAVLDPEVPSHRF